MGVAVLALAVRAPVAQAATDSHGCDTVTQEWVPDVVVGGVVTAVGHCAQKVGSGDTANTCAEYNSRGIYDIPRGDSRYRSGLDRDGDGRACERNEGNGNSWDNGRRDGRWDYNRDCRDDRQFRTSRADVTRWCDDWDRGHRPTTRPTATTTETTTAPAPAPNVIVVPAPSSGGGNPTSYGNSVPRGSVNTGGLDRAHAA
jgi:hypothetical protein